MKPFSRQLGGLLLMCAGLAMTTLALAKLWLAPNVFTATALVAVPPPQPAPNPGTVGGVGFEPTELERIQAKLVLHQVITNLDLQRKWAEQTKAEAPLPMDKAYQLLREQLEVRRQSSNASLIEIRVRSYAAAEAATLANRIAQVYRDTRRENGAVVQIIEDAQPPPKGRRSGGTSALALFMVGVAGLGGGYWVLRSAGLLGSNPPRPAA